MCNPHLNLFVCVLSITYFLKAREYTIVMIYHIYNI